MGCLRGFQQVLGYKVANKIVDNDSFYIIDQFNMLKKFIVYNSIPFEDVRLQRIGSKQSKHYGNSIQVLLFIDWNDKSIDVCDIKTYDLDANK